MSWFSHMKIVHKLLLLIIMAVVSLVVVGYTGYHYLISANKNVNGMYKDHLIPVLVMNDNRSIMHGISADLFELMFTIDVTQKEALRKDIAKRDVAFDKNLAEYENTDLDLFETEKLTELKANLVKHREARKAVLELGLANKNVEAYDYYNKNVRVVAEKVQTNLREMAKYNKEQAVEVNKQNDRDFVLANKIVIGIITVSVILMITLGWITCSIIDKSLKTIVSAIEEVASGNLAIKEVEIYSQDEMGQVATALNIMVKAVNAMIQQIHSLSEQVAVSSEQMTVGTEQSAQAANQVAVSITNVANGAEIQLKTVHESITIVEQMSAGIERIAVSATNVNATVERTSNAAHKGRQAIEQATNQMTTIEDSVIHSAQGVAKLGERSKEIGQIVDAISGIAGQTNLLALNAAIEAARAGEQGRGFAVVAEEVRKLAEQSQEATKQIATLISEIRSDTDKAVLTMATGTQEVKRGTEVVAAAGKSFSEIANFIEQVSNQVRDISVAIQQMASGSKQIVSSVQTIDAISKDTAGYTQTVAAATEEQSASNEEIAASSVALASMAEKMRAIVVQFKV